MENQIIFLGNYSSGKTCLVNYLYGAVKIKLDNNDKINKIYCDEYEKYIIDTYGLDIEGRDISEFEKEIKFSFMVFIVCKYDNYKNKDILKYIKYCEDKRKELENKNIYIVVTHADKILKKDPKLFGIIENYFKRPLYFVYTGEKPLKMEKNIDLDSFKCLVEKKNYEIWLLEEFKKVMTISYEDLKNNYFYCFGKYKLFQKNTNCCVNGKSCEYKANLKFPELIELDGKNSKYINTDFEKLKYLYGIINKNFRQDFNDGHILINYNSIWYFVTKKDGKIVDYVIVPDKIETPVNNDCCII